MERNEDLILDEDLENEQSELIDIEDSILNSIHYVLLDNCLQPQDDLP